MTGQILSRPIPPAPAEPGLDVLLVDAEDCYDTWLRGIPFLAWLDALLAWLLHLVRVWMNEPTRPALPLLAAYLENAGFSVAALTDLSEGLSFIKRRKLSQLLRRRPLVVGVSTSAMKEPRTLERIAAQVRRESPASCLVLGGFGAEYGPAMRRLGDVVVTRYGELALVKLAQALRSRLDLDSVAGMTRGEDGVRLLAGRLSYDPGERMLPPDWGVLGRRLRCCAVEASRGCRYNCSYCTFLGKNRHACRKPADVLEEVADDVRRHGARYIEFVDSSLTSEPDFIFEFLELLRKAGLPVVWRCFGRVDDFARHPGLAEAMVRAGCQQVFLGIESIHDHILLKMRKGYGRSLIEKGLAAIDAADLQVHANFIVGFPGETAQTVDETAAFISAAHFQSVYLAALMVPRSLFAQARADPEFFNHLSGESPRSWSHDTMDYRQAWRLARRAAWRINLRLMYPLAFMPGARVPEYEPEATPPA